MKLIAGINYIGNGFQVVSDGYNQLNMVSSREYTTVLVGGIRTDISAYNNADIFFTNKIIKAELNPLELMGRFETTTLHRVVSFKNNGFVIVNFQLGDNHIFEYKFTYINGVISVDVGKLLD